MARSNTWPAVIRAFRDLAATAPETLTLWYETRSFPPDPMIPERCGASAFATIALAYLGDATDGANLIAPLRALPGILMDGIGVVAMQDLSTIANEPTQPMPFLDHSTFLLDLEDETIDTLTRIAGAASGSPLVSLQIRHLGGAFARSQPTDGAVGSVKQPFVLVGIGVPAVPGLAEAITATYRRLDDELGGHTDGRTVPNFLSAREDVDRVWSPETRARLAAIKRAVDPSSTIQNNRPVLRSEERRIVG